MSPVFDFADVDPEDEDWRDRAEREGLLLDREAEPERDTIDRRALVNALADLVMADLRRAP